MAMMSPSKGGSQLAESFLNNTATQAPTLSPIQAPQGRLPSGPVAMPQPVGPMFSAQFAPKAAPVNPFLTIFGRGPAQGPQTPWYEASNAIDKAPTSQAGIFGV